MTDPQRWTVPLDGGYVVGESWAGSGPVVVLLHSGVTDRRCWADVVGGLRGLAAVVAYDRRGFGESPPARHPFSHLDDLDALLPLVVPGPADRPVWLVGSSMGGGLAIDAALTRPGRFAGLVLLAPAISGEPEDADAGAAPDPVTDDQFAALTAAYRDGDLEAAVRWHTRVWLDGPHRPEGRVGGAVRALAVAMNTIVVGHELAEGALDEEEGGGSGVDAWHRLDELRLPVTVACGDADVPALVARCRWLADRIPGARHRTLPGTAHLPYLDAPGLVVDVVREALAG